MASPPDNKETNPPLAEHVAESVDAIARFHEEHYRSASSLQRAMDVLTEQLGRPVFAALVVCGIAAWIAFAAARTGGRVEAPPFAWLELAATVAALVVAMLILVTQRRQDKLSERRAQLTLELALLADRKNAKIIALLEELRRDHPDVPDRKDMESDEMAKAADPQSVLAAIDERNAEPTRAPTAKVRAHPARRTAPPKSSTLA
jgi:uncharacterized membrane protein